MRRYLFAALFLVACTTPAPAAVQAEFLLASTAEMENPHDIKLSPDGAWLFVSDVGNDRVLVLDANSLELIGHFGADHQDGTHDVDFDAAGRLYVADTHNHRITIYELDGAMGNLVGELSANLRKPEGVLVGTDGRVFATGAGSGNLLLYEKGIVTRELGGLSAPHDLEFAPNGDLWVADAGNDRLLRVSQDFEIKTILEGAPYDFDGPRYMDVAPDGTLVLADKNTHRVLVIGEDGSILGIIGEGGSGEGPGKFRTPEGVELSGDTVWIADSGNDRIVKYRLTWD